MARKIRIEYPGAIYHVMNRGDRREAIFKDDLDRRRFLATLGEACAKTDWQVHAYCLMGNHFHLIVETPQPNLVAGMKWFLGTYTSRFNRRHKLFGHLFSGRYKALVVDGSGHGYLRTVCDYVHLNPARAKLLTDAEPLRAYAWSSYGDYLRKPSERAAWLRVGRLFGEMGIPQDSAAGRQQFELRMEDRRGEETGAEWKAIRRCLGEESFRQVREELAKATQAALASAEAELGSRPKGDPVKVALARRLRQETTVTLKWISARLHTGAWTHLNKRLYDQRKASQGAGS